MGLRVGVVGATGVVGREIISILEQRRVQMDELRLLASSRSVGELISFEGTTLAVKEAMPANFENLDIVLASAGAEPTRGLEPSIRRSGAILIDNSSAFRMEPNVPLIVPEVNIHALDDHCGIIANPNCVAALLTVAIAPIHAVVGVRRIVLTTFQSASGAGLAAMEELKSQARAALDGRAVVAEALSHPLAFNVFSHDSAIGNDGYNGEEVKVMVETRKILSDPDLAIAATCVRVPVLRAHTLSMNLTLKRSLSAQGAQDILKDAPGIELVDDRARNIFPMPCVASGRDPVYVGRIRQDTSQEEGLGIELFVCGDQLRKGAALNAVQVMESVVERYV